jgi:hypothetical protein
MNSQERKALQSLLAQLVEIHGGREIPRPTFCPAMRMQMMILSEPMQTLATTTTGEAANECVG